MEMRPLLYSELSPWYRLIDPLDEHREEAGVYLEALLGAEVPLTGTLLELGAGAGHNAYYLKRNFSCTLTDISDEMLGLSRDINPECEHLTGEMKTCGSVGNSTQSSSTTPSCTC